MKKTQKILSILLVAAMVLGLAPISVFNTIASADSTPPTNVSLATDIYNASTFQAPDTSLTTFTASVTATEIIRVAHGADEFTLGDQVVQANDYGIPMADASWNTGAEPYGKSGLIPTNPTVVLTVPGFDIGNASLETTGITGNIGSPSISGSTATWTYPTNNNISATAGTNITYKVTYSLQGVTGTYVAYGASRCESIESPAAVAIHFMTGRASTKQAYACLASMGRLYAKGAKHSMAVATPDSMNGFLTWAITKSTAGSVDQDDLGLGQGNASTSVNAILSSYTNTNIQGGKPFSAFKVGKNQGSSDAGKYRCNVSVQEDKHRPLTTIYLDKGRTSNNATLGLPAQATFANVGFFLDYMDVNPTDSTHSYAKLGVIHAGSGHREWGTEADSCGFSDRDSVFGIGSNTTVIRARWGHITVDFTGTGGTASAQNTLAVEYIANNPESDHTEAKSTVGFDVDTVVYDSSVLQNLISGIKSGTGSMTVNSTTVNFNKGKDPQPGNYTSGWDNYETALKNAYAVLHTYDKTQSAIDTAASNLASAYNALSGFHTTVNYNVEYVCDSVVLARYTGSAPAGTIVKGYNATIPNYAKSVSNPFIEKVLTGQNATETITFTFTKNSYALNVVSNDDVNGATPQQVMFTYGDPVTEADLQPYQGTKAHYHFVGWFTDAECEDALDFTGLKMSSVYENGAYIGRLSNGSSVIYGKWELDPVYVHWNTTISGFSIPDTELTPGDIIAEPSPEPDPTTVNPNLRFSGWYSDSAYTTPYVFGSAIGYSDVTVYAKIIDLTDGIVSFVSNGGSPVADLTDLNAGSVIQQPTCTRAGYNLDGWYTTPDFQAGTKMSFPYTMTSRQGFILYAKWNAQMHRIKLNLGDPSDHPEYDSNNGLNSAYEGYGVNYPDYIEGYTDDVITAPPTPRKFGYEFVRWTYRGADYNFSTNNKIPSQDITLNAVFRTSDTAALVEVSAYKEEYGDVTPITQARCGDTVLIRVKASTTFYSGSTVLVFMYDKNFYTLVGSGANAVTLNPDNGYVSGIDASASVITDSSRLLWPAGCDSSTYNAIQVAIDPTVSASNYNCEPMNDGNWLLEFRLTVNNGLTEGDSGIVYMSNDWTRTVDNVMGSQFISWAANDTTAVSRTQNNLVLPDLTYANAEVEIEPSPRPSTTAVVSPTTGAWAANDSAPRTYTGEPGQPITGYTDPTKTGYTLTGFIKVDTNGDPILDNDDNEIEWIPGYYAAESGTYNAQWEANSYTVTFYKDAEGTVVYKQDDLVYDTDTIAKPTDPTKSGYTFTGWVDAGGNPVADSDFPMTLPIGGKEFFATWTERTDMPFKVRVHYADRTTDLAYATTTGYTVKIVETVPASPEANTYYVAYADLPEQAGYIFNPTNENNELQAVVSGDESNVTVLNVYYDPMPLTLTFFADGGTFENGQETMTVSATYGVPFADVKPAVNPIKPGYSFGITAANYKYTTGAGTLTNIPKNGESAFTLIYRGSGANSAVPTYFTAQWTANSYQATFHANYGTDTGAYFDNDASVVTKTATAAYQANITAPAAPAKPGYTFKGWSTDGSTVITTPKMTSYAAEVGGNAMDFYAVWELTSYNVYYTVDGVQQNDLTAEKHIGDEVTLPAAPTKTGYSFSGWSTSDATIANGKFTMPGKNVTVAGTFSANDYDAKFYKESADTTAFATVPTAFDSKVQFPATNPSKFGYEFSGWALPSAPDVAVGNNTVTMDNVNGLSFVAIWTPVQQNYEVHIYKQNTDGSYSATADQVLSGNAYKALTGATVSYTAPNVEGFTYDAANSTASGTIPAVEADAPLTLVIKYTRNKYTITYNKANGENNDTVQAYYGSTLTAPTEPTKTGNTFRNWLCNYDSATYSTASIASFVVPAQNVTFTAQWNVIKYKADFYKYADDVATFASITNIEYNTSFNLPAGPVVTGYSFEGWKNVDNDEVKAAGASVTMGAADMTFVAVLEAESYDAEFYESATATTAFATVPTDFDAAIVAPATDPSKTGYTFVCWTTTANNIDTRVYFTGANAEKMNDVNGKKYYAYFTANSYDVTFDANGGYFDGDTTKTTKDVSTVFGEIPTAPASPVKAGYNFGGWTPALSELDTTSKVTYTAVWNAKTDMTFKVNVYTMKADGEYAPAVTSSYNTGTTGQAFTLVAGTHYTVNSGFQLNTDDSVLTKTIPADSVAEFDVYIDRVSKTLTKTIDGNSTTTQVLYGASVTEPVAPTKDGYELDYWKNGATNERVTFPFNMPNSDVEIVAVWKAVPQAYEIHVYKQDITGQYTETYETISGNDYMADTASQVSYEMPDITGFSKDTANSTLTGTIPATGTLVLVAKYTRDQFTITYMNGTTEFTTQTYYFEEEVSAPTTEPTNTGYDFGGWSANGTEVDFDTYEMGADDVTFDAIWTATDYTISYAYTGTVPTGAPAVPADRTATVENTNIAVESEPTLIGYTFSGWSTDDATVTANHFDMPANDVAFTGSWTINEYQVTFKFGNGDEDQVGNVDYNAAINAPTEPTRAGYSFAGWTSSLDNETYDTEDFPLTMGTQAIIFQANWEFVDYEVTFAAEGIPAETVTVPATLTGKHIGNNIFLDSYNTSYAGYTFNGWTAVNDTTSEKITISADAFVMPASDVTVTGSWTAINYNVIYSVADPAYGTGVAAPATVQNKHVGDTITVAGGLTLAGYDFDGWYKDGEKVTSFTMPAADVTLTASWIAKDLTVSYSTNGATAIINDVDEPTIPADVTGKHYGDEITVAQPLELAGYTFDGWYLDDQKVTTFTMPTTDVELTAEWTANELTVTYNAADPAYGNAPANPVDSNTYTRGDEVTVAEGLTLEGYEFDGWYYNGQKVTTFDMPATDVELTASWTPIDYTVEYSYTNDPDHDIEAPALPADITCKHVGDTITLAAGPTLAGYTFDGWYYGDQKVTSFTMPADDVTVTGSWSAVDYTVTYQYVDAPDGVAAVPAQATKNVGDTVTVAAVPSFTGYTFAGWTYAGADYEEDDTITMPAANITLVGTWTVNSYEVKFVSGDTTVNTANLNYGATITAPTNPVKNGYTFTGWEYDGKTYTVEQVNAMTVVAADMTFDAQFSANEQDYYVNVFLMGLDEEYPVTPAETITVSDDEDAFTGNTVTYTPAAKTGFEIDNDASTLSGEIPATGSLTLIAKYSRKSYDVTYDYDNGEEDGSDSYLYQQALTTPTAPTKTGYSFKGWKYSVDNRTYTNLALIEMPASNVTLTAQWQINNYTVSYKDADGEVYETKSVTYGDAVPAPDENPALENYTFEGWSVGDKFYDEDMIEIVTEGEGEALTMPAGELNLTPVFERVPVAITIKPESTTVIDEDHTDELEDGTIVNGYIFGLEQRLTEEQLDADYLSVEGDGTLIYTPTKYGKYGTGAKVEVYDNVEEKVVATYIIVIYGDLNGDAIVNQSDLGVLNNELREYTSWSDKNSDEFCYERLLAADLAGEDGEGNRDEQITSDDKAALLSVTSYRARIDQTDGSIA